MLAHGETVIRLRGIPVLDPYSQGETGLDWENPDPLPINGCAVYPANTGEVVDVGRDQAEERLSVLLPHGADVTYKDRLVIRGEVYSVEGFPHDWHHPITGWEPGMSLTAVRKVG